MKNIKYHYTSVDGISAILQSQKLRLTRSEFLNDPDDCRVLFTLVRDYLNRKRAGIEKQLDSSELQQIHKNAPLIDYIEFLQKHIHLYVLSLTDNNDEMSMWNYYGSSGMQLHIEIEELTKEITKSFTSSNQYIALSPVYYIPTPDNTSVEDISFEPFYTFRLDNNAKSNIFYENSKRTGKDGHAHPLYQTTALSGFVDTYIKGYVKSLQHLLSERQISVTSTSEEIFRAVHNNTNILNNYLEFKKDLTLYLLVLSAFIKNDSYAYENEFRIVLFENSLTQSVNVDYAVQSMQSQKYIRPFMETKKVGVSFIRGITLSPLTRNLPIDDDLYCHIIREFAEKKTKAPSTVCYSKHRIRW